MSTAKPRSPSMEIEWGKKRAAVEQSDEETAITSSSPTLSSESSRSASPLPAFVSQQEDALAKRLKRTVTSIPKHLTCFLTNELMVDPVLAADGNTYERNAVLNWLATHNTSPMDPRCPLDAYRLMPNRAMKMLVEELVASGELENELVVSYLQRKDALSHEHARRLYHGGKIAEAAELGLPVAQGIMAKRCYFGLDGVAKDRVQSVEWARKAAAGGDRLVLSMLGYAYDQGEGGLAKDWATAVKWYEKAAEQGHATSMTNIGYLYGAGGHGLDKDVLSAARWYRRAALGGCEYGMCNLGNCYYDGTGVIKDLATARTWFQKAADKGDVDSKSALGLMLVKGEGGPMDAKRGIALWEQSAGEGHPVAQSNLKELERVLGAATFTKEPRSPVKI